MKSYVHGYSRRESLRLADQASTLEGILHHDTQYPAGSTVLEAGCGIGAQTVILAKSSPRARFTSVDISGDSLRRARLAARRHGLSNVRFVQADFFDLPFDDGSFDHVFVCFVLEHLPDPVRALRSVARVLKKGGTITVIEGDHGSVVMHPESPAARRAIQCLVELQARAKGNALIGRELYPLLRAARFSDVRVSPRIIYADAGRPALVKGFTLNTFTAMVQGVRADALAQNIATEKEWAAGIRGLRNAAKAGGSFSYTFYKAAGVKP